ncbi:hypothetical protein F5144DRAFT_617875 [Chaetomium tenue]|uniref:Uncharacterized protein n=1 Tax=Chaetomium tenue TaxID=1854479 RepID=A0ACB7PQU8_9PEZI|nr:hypothetical protein F5144DRAFT_617875 [Chaetomium globosum]
MQAPVCPDCFTGTIRGDVTPTGHEEVINGLPTYVTGPEPGVQPLGSVVLITDAFGWKLRNSRVLADAYAKRVPKALTALRLLPTILLFLFHTRQSVAHPRVLAFVTALRAANTTTTNPNPTYPSPFLPAPNKIGIAGLCWGGLHAVLLTHDTPRNRTGDSNGDGASQPLIDCAFTAHPSLLSFPGHIEGVVRPLSVANGDDDRYMGKEKMGVLVRVLEGKNMVDAGGEVGGGGDGGLGPRYEAVVYPGAKHGFAVRGDKADPMQRERGEQSEDQAVMWFQRWFA